MNFVRSLSLSLSLPFVGEFFRFHRDRIRANPCRILIKKDSWQGKAEPWGEDRKDVDRPWCVLARQMEFPCPFVSVGRSKSRSYPSGISYSLVKFYNLRSRPGNGNLMCFALDL